MHWRTVAKKDLFALPIQQDCLEQNMNNEMVLNHPRTVRMVRFRIDSDRK